MRIRKHAKISPLMYATTTSFPSQATHVQSSHLNCQLNQSPWDVLTFPIDEDPAAALPSQFVINGYTDNGTFYDSNGPAATASIMKLDEMKEDINYPKWNYNIAEVTTDLVKYEGAVDEDMELELGLMDNTSGITSNSNLCDGYSKQVEEEGVVPETYSGARRRPRAKKSSSSSSNPYEFFYYSGFGPMWGKKRGGVTSGNNNNVSAASTSVECNMAEEGSHGAHYFEDYFGYVEDELGYEAEENGKKKKRARKPIKARSLKSLM